MSKLPNVRNLQAVSQSTQRSTQNAFGGLKRAESCRDGELYDMNNMTSRHYPVMASRNKRRIDHSIPEGVGTGIDRMMGEGTKRIWTEMNNIWFYDEDMVWVPADNHNDIRTMHRIKVFSGAAPQRELIRFGDRLLIFPEKLIVNLVEKLTGCYDTQVIPQQGGLLPDELPLAGNHPGEMVLAGRNAAEGSGYRRYYSDGTAWRDCGAFPERMEAEINLGAGTIRLQNGTIYGESASANELLFTIPSGSVDWQGNGFKVGDAVKIEGFTTEPRNNKIAIIREIAGGVLRFSDNCFTIPEGETQYEETGTFRISREMPEFDFCFSGGNRLWGAKDKEIFASKLGDPTNFYVFDGLSTDSWYLETQGYGKFSAGIWYQGYPTIFRENAVLRIYGSMPSAFQTTQTPIAGVRAGAEDTLKEAGGLLFYLGKKTMMIWNGSDAPEECSGIFGELEMGKASPAGRVAEANDTQYMIYTNFDEPGNKGTKITSLLVFDTTRGLWTVESGRFRALKMINNEIYGIETVTGNMLQLTGNEDGIPGAEYEEGLTSYAEFGDFDDTPYTERLTGMVLRAKIEAGKTVTVKLRYQGEETWMTVGAMSGAGYKKSYYIPISGKRADSYRIRLEADGGWLLYELTRERTIGSEIT